MAKLQAYGIRGDYIKWFRSYLTYRTQYVNFNGEEFAEHTLKCGVLQGSLLGPLFFIIFVNDMFNVLYADDTCICISGSDINALFEVLNIELAALLEWLNANRLTLNVDKTFYMLFHRKCIKTDNLKLTIGQGTPKQTSQCKYLGLIIDNKLNWAANIAHVKSKTSKCVGILLKARPSLTSLFAIHKNDIQKTWIVINNTLNNNSRNSIQSEFIVNNNKLTDPGDIANAFNDYFINIGRQLSDKIQSPHHYSDYLHNQVESHLQLKPISEIDISNTINNLKNKASYGHDEISNKLIKRAGPALIKSLKLMVNQMLFSGIFPDRLKISKVKPLFKAGDPVLISNYRPISLLPSLSKIFEHIIFRQLFDYMTDNNLFAIEQYGFLSDHSTELAALHLIDYLTKQMDVGEIPINKRNIDLSKAFDTLDHTILLAKLRYYGIRGVAHKFMLNYLSHRYQYVEYNGVQS